MQRPDDEKRRKITAAAAQLFATRPYHEVTLDLVAAAAKVGKGTLYVYFAGKEQLYAALLDDGFTTLLDGLRPLLDDESRAAREALGIVVQGVLEHARRLPHLFHLMRAGQQLPCADRLAQHRTALMQVVEHIVRRGVRSGEFEDAHPELTAAYLPALVRAAVLYGPNRLSTETVTEHILTVLCSGLEPRARAASKVGTRKKRLGSKPRAGGRSR